MSSKLQVAFLITAWIGCLFGQALGEAPKSRPEKWAKPVKADGITKEDLPNLHQVTDNFYRSAQPTALGMKQAEKLGVKTVINLRSFHSDRSLLEGTKLQGEHITMKAWHPEEKELVRFLKLITDKKNLPVLLHCQHGADRTGLLCATYRVVVQGWKKEDAIQEMTEGEFGFHEVWDNIIHEVRDLPVEELRKKAGISEPVK